MASLMEDTIQILPDATTLPTSSPEIPSEKSSEILPVRRIIVPGHFYTHFYTSKSGYQVALSVYPNGFGSGKGTHVSVFLHLMKGPNDDSLPFPVHGIFTIKIILIEDHHLSNRANPARQGHFTHLPYIAERSVSFDESIPIECRERVTKGEGATGWGYQKFLSHHDLSRMNILKDNTMCFEISYVPIYQPGVSIFLLKPDWCDLSQLNSTTPPCVRTLSNYSSYRKTNSTWYSEPFYSTANGGYKLQLRVDANGVGLSRGNYLSLCVYLMKGEHDDELSWPLNASITVELLNRCSDKYHIRRTIHHHKAPLKYRERVVDGIRAPGGRGCAQFVSHCKIKDTSDHTVSYVNIFFRIVNVVVI